MNKNICLRVCWFVHHPNVSLQTPPMDTTDLLLCEIHMVALKIQDSRVLLSVPRGVVHEIEEHFLVSLRSKHHKISQTTMTFYKTRHFRKHYSIPLNRTTFQIMEKKNFLFLPGPKVNQNKCMSHHEKNTKTCGVLSVARGSTEPNNNYRRVKIPSFKSRHLSQIKVMYHCPAASSLGSVWHYTVWKFNKPRSAPDRRRTSSVKGINPSPVKNRTLSFAYCYHGDGSTLIRGGSTVLTDIYKVCFRPRKLNI